MEMVLRHARMQRVAKEKKGWFFMIRMTLSFWGPMCLILIGIQLI